jgi:twitching motility protein PilI
MQKKGNKEAFAKLLEYEKRSAAFTPGTRGGSGPASEWSGVTFLLGESRLACDIDRINEILPVPQPTPVPGTKPWIIGLANVRGALLTIVDLPWFLSGERSVITARSRLLASMLQKAPIGLLIDEVFGQRHFLEVDSNDAKLDDSSPLRHYVSKEYTVGTENWLALDLDRLFNTAEFLNGAAD